MNGQRSRPLFPWINLMATEPFYVLHIAAFSSYFAARATNSPDLSHCLLQREIQAILAFSVLAVVKMVKEETWEACIADTLLYAKGFLFALALVINHHVAICYLVSFLVIFVLTQQPPYDGVGDSSQLTPLQLESVLTEGSTSRFWLVEFRSSCSPACIRTSRIVPDLSTVYSNKSISFGIVDLGHFPNVAEKIGIQLGQLPTYILFDNAVEVARFPEFYSEAKASIPTITKNILCRHFDLDRRLIEYNDPALRRACSDVVTEADKLINGFDMSLSLKTNNNEAEMVECEVLWAVLSEAVKEKVKPKPGLAIDEALENHVAFYKQFKTIRINPKLSLASAMRDIAKKSSQSRNPNKGFCGSKIARTMSCGPWV
ncbi:hypothetical protein J5N97_012889 [Dioscorea zingiberensis]|uniref:Thioredoxin domain-containing protein n=1 Tax=Dioscorea zingiberensis TaxID=325984 RepID=A0A9D5HI59_9LILI|nr:hypothetical protein J5N97_012889 [Dioscorea zingiberensis]